MKAIGIMACLLLVACSGGREDSEDKAFEDLTETTERAAEVERQLEAKKERMDAALDEATDKASREEPPQR